MLPRSLLPLTFANRTAPRDAPELMDDPALDPVTLEACLKDLAGVNRLSLGYRPILAFADRLAARGGRVKILDVGSGYGDGLRVLARRLAARGVAADLVGADLNPQVVAIAAAATPSTLPIRYEVADARELGGERFDAVLCSLFTHHLEDDEVVAFLRFLDAAPAFLVNDLYRSAFAARGFRLATRLLGRHTIVRHDGPVSFARAFRRADWERLLAAAGVRDARVFIGAPFRMCVEKRP